MAHALYKQERGINIATCYSTALELFSLVQYHRNMPFHQKDVGASFTKSLFMGHVVENWLWPYPTLATEEQELLGPMLQTFRDFCQRHIDSARIDREAQIPEAAIQALKGLGFFGLNIPTEYGGIGLSGTGYARLMEEAGSVDGSLAAFLAAHHSIGLKGLLLFGTEEQKRRYLPRLATGEMIAAFALTESSAGSDAAQLQLKASPRPDGSFVLNGSKIWITNGGVADFFTVFARVPSPSDNKPHITAFLVERAFGVKSGPPEHKLGIRGSTTNALYFEDVRVPAENVLGEVGKGFKLALSILNSGRLGMAAIALGGAKRLTSLAVTHAKERFAFGKPIAQFDQIRGKIASMVLDSYILESMTYLTAGRMDQGGWDYSLESALCKIFGGELSWHTADDALQIAGGAGFMQEYPYERMLRDARITLIFEGTNEVLRSFVALGGLQAPGELWKQLAAEAAHLWDNKQSLASSVFHKIRAWVGWEQKLSFVPSVLQPFYRTFLKYTRALAWQVDRALYRHREKITDDQFVQVRLANLAMGLYGLAACLSRTCHLIQQKRETESAVTFLQRVSLRLERFMDEQLQSIASSLDEQQRATAEEAYQHGGYPYPWIS